MREIRPSGSEGGVADNGHPYPYKEARGRIGFRAVRQNCADRFQCSLRPDPAAGGRSGNGAGEGTPILDEGHTQRCRLSDRTVPPLQRSSVHRLVGHDSDLIAVRKSFAIGGNPFDTFKILMNCLLIFIKP